jgi:GNAT superfamily N-acetyltransferase
MGEVSDITPAFGGKILPPSAITQNHDLSQFHSGNDALDDWVRLRALKSEGRSARTYVVALGQLVVGYYCISTGAEKRSNIPTRLTRNMPEAVPLVILGRLAVDVDYQGKGVGAGMLKDALQRSLQISKIAGSRAVILHAIDQNAVSFYLKYGFIEFPNETKTMFLPMETIEKALP